MNIGTTIKLGHLIGTVIGHAPAATDLPESPSGYVIISWAGKPVPTKLAVEDARLFEVKG